MTLYSFIKLCLLRAFSRLLLNLLVICTVITTLLTRMSLTLIQVGYISHYSLTWSSRRYGDVSRRDSRIFFLQPNKGGSIHVNLGIWCQFYSNKLVETKRKGKKNREVEEQPIDKKTLKSYHPNLWTLFASFFSKGKKYGILWDNWKFEQWMDIWWY